MPGMSGPMLADQLLARFAGARVLVMSGYDERQVVQRYVVEKGFTLIIKPFQLHNLCAAVKKALETVPADLARWYSFHYLMGRSGRDFRDHHVVHGKHQLAAERGQ